MRTKRKRQKGKFEKKNRKRRSGKDSVNGDYRYFPLSEYALNTVCLLQLQKQKERGHISVDVDHFTNEQMERMVFDKDYNPLKQQGEREMDEESDPEDEARKAELRARFAAAS